jgi:hypothetical protein
MSITSLILPSIPMGLGIAADVFAVTLITAILFPETFRKYWLAWLLAVGGGHAILPMAGQLSIIYLGPFLQEWIGLPTFWVETLKTVATFAGCYFLWTFLKGVFAGVRDSNVDVFTGLTVVAWWGCTADAAYSGAPKAAQAEAYDWGLYEIIVSNIIAAGIVMIVCVLAIVLGMFAYRFCRKPMFQIGAFYIEFAILGYFLLFFALTRGNALLAYTSYGSANVSLEAIAATAAVVYVALLFHRNWSDIYQAQTERLAFKAEEAIAG